MSEPLTVYIEHKPEYYVGGIGVTIRCRPSEDSEAQRLKDEIHELCRRWGKEVGEPL